MCTGAGLRSTNPLNRVDCEIGRRSAAIGIYSNDVALMSRAVATPIEQRDCCSGGDLCIESLEQLLAVPEKGREEGRGSEHAGSLTFAGPCGGVTFSTTRDLTCVAAGLCYAEYLTGQAVSFDGAYAVELGKQRWIPLGCVPDLRSTVTPAAEAGRWDAVWPAQSSLKAYLGCPGVSKESLPPPQPSQRSSVHSSATRHGECLKKRSNRS